MKKLSLAALVFLAACGVRSSSSYYGPRTYSGGGLPPDPPGVPSSAPDYLIDSGAAVQPPFGTYAITTNGQGDWILGWQGDNTQHQFTGDIYCPVGCDMTAVFTNALPGDSIRTIANNHVGFDGVTGPEIRQAMNISTFATGGPDSPVTFDLYIDGRPAINPYVVFSSGRQLATSDLMPFNLVPDTAVFADQADLAPLFKMPKDKEGKTFTLPAPPPRAGGSHTESKPQVVEASAQQ
jgi:hypothetical protein